MKTATFYFDEGLRPLLTPSKRTAALPCKFRGPQTVKHLIESLGIPHTEIGLVQSNKKVVGLDYRVEDGDRVVVNAVDAEAATATEPRFVLDGHLGRLASRLRMLGMDCLYQNGYDDAELAAVAAGEERILLTRDRRLLMRKSIRKGHLVRSPEPDQQMREVARRFHLLMWIRPFQRCIRCNHMLESVPKAEIVERLQPLTRKYFNSFRICRACGQLYWSGSHVDRMQRVIATLNE